MKRRASRHIPLKHASSGLVRLGNILEATGIEKGSYGNDE